ncbi:MAG: PAC2 family protein, partial [Nitrososphaera sp.]|nr:PAC2 family protein [Nitrososphaera sp.]
MVDHNIEIRKLKDVNLKGGIVIDGFPSAGLANAIASECLIHSLKTEFVAVLDSTSFPALSIIRGAAPSFPARIYANEELKLGIFVSELSL